LFVRPAVDVELLVFAGLEFEEGSTCKADELTRFASLLFVVLGLVSAGLLFSASVDEATLTGSLSMLGFLSALSVGFLSDAILGVLPSSVRESVDVFTGFMLVVATLELFVSGTRPVEDDPFPLAGVL
jgi:hypothetical protein